MRENIFSDLYNKVMSFFVQQEASEKTKSAAISRLKTVLAQDRVGFSERAIQMLKDEMLLCIAKYMEIDEESFDLQISPKDDTTVLELSIPVIRPKTDEEIDKAIEEENEKLKQKAREIADELEGIVKETVEELKSDLKEDYDIDAVDEEEDIEEENSEEKAEDDNTNSSDEGEQDEPTDDNTEEEIEIKKENPFEEEKTAKK